MVIYLLFTLLCKLKNSFSINYVSSSYSYSFIQTSQSMEYLSKSNMISQNSYYYSNSISSLNYVASNSYSYYISKMPSIMPSTKEKEVNPAVNFETNLVIEGIQNNIFDKVDKKIFLQTTSHIMKISHQNLYWKNSYFETQLIKTNLRTQNNNLKLRIIIQVNITLSGIYSQYIKNPTMLFTVLSTNLDLGLNSNTFNNYLQTLSTLSNLFKFSNVNLISAANNNLKILGLELVVNVTNNNTCFPTFIPTIVPTNSPTIVPTNSPTIIPTNSPTIIPTNSPIIIPTIVPIIISTIVPTIIPTISPTIIPTMTKTLNPSLSPSLRPSFRITNRNATSEKVLSSDNAGNMLIYLIYIPVSVVFIAIILCFTTYRSRKHLERLTPEPHNETKEYKHIGEPIIFKPNKIHEKSDKKIYKTVSLLNNNNNKDLSETDSD